MSDPTGGVSSAYAAVGLITFASVQHGINGDALIASFAGAAVFALHSKNEPIYERMIYMLISIPVGYIIAPYVNEFQQKYTGIDGVVICSFLASAGIVRIAKVFLDRIDEFKLSSVFSGIAGIFKSNKKGGDK